MWKIKWCDDAGKAVYTGLSEYATKELAEEALRVITGRNIRRNLNAVIYLVEQIEERVEDSTDGTSFKDFIESLSYQN